MRRALFVVFFPPFGPLVYHEAPQWRRGSDPPSLTPTPKTLSRTHHVQSVARMRPSRRRPPLCRNVRHDAGPCKREASLPVLVHADRGEPQAGTMKHILLQAVSGDSSIGNCGSAQCAKYPSASSLLLNTHLNFLNTQEVLQSFMDATLWLFLYQS